MSFRDNFEDRDPLKSAGQAMRERGHKLPCYCLPSELGKIMDSIKINSTSDIWRKTAKSRLRFELAGLAFACHRESNAEDYARHLWAKGSVHWMGKANPNAAEYLLKEAKAFREFYPEMSFEVVESGDARAELVFTDGCLGGWGRDPWAIARNLSLSKKDICTYCREAFRIWTQPLGLRTDIGPKKDENCRLCVTKP